MAFLDNSGDIILDAVLTDVGRKRMANGNFRITKFALGDDEIDYNLYNTNHPSGAAYSDLEILQAPILEAFTTVNATINYGLVSYARNDILYLPTITINNKLVDLLVFTGSTNVIYVPDDNKFNSAGKNTGDLLTLQGGAGTVPGASAVLREQNADAGTRFILVETGINNADIPSTAANQSTYLLNIGLNDKQFMVGYDARFIQSPLGPLGTFSFQGGENQAVRLKVALGAGKGVQNARNISNYAETPVKAAVSRLYKPNTGNDYTVDKSNIAGARGAFTALSFRMREDLTITDYTKYGSINQNLFGDGETYHYIDTIAYVKGITTNTTLQIPLRIIRVV